VCALWGQVASRLALIAVICTLLLPDLGIALAGSVETTGQPSIDASIPIDAEAASASEADASRLANDGPNDEPEAPAPLALPPALRIQESDRRLERLGTWVAGSSSAASGGGYLYSSRAGSAVTMHFRGTRVAWIGPVGPTYGRAEVYVDGRLMNRVSLYAPSYAHQKVVWQLSGLPDTAHTLTIRVTGTKSEASSGTIVVLDGLDVVSDAAGGTAEVYGARLRIEESNRRLERLGTWVAGSSSAASGGGYLYSSRAGSAVTMHFRGTRVAWIGPVGPTYGRAEVYVDGRLMNRVSLYAPSYAHQKVVWQLSGLPDTAHTLTIRVTGTKSEASSGTLVVLDGFDIIADAAGGVAQIHDLTVRHRYPWRHYIVVDKSEFRLYWYRDGRLVKTYPVAHGRNGYTPAAIWRIDSKYITDPGSVYGPRKMRLYRQTKRADGTYTYVYTRYLIHGTNNPASIGTMASNGCIRMYNADVLELYPQVPLGTMVVTQE